MHSLKFDKRISCVTFINENIIAIAGDGEYIEFFNFIVPSSIRKLKAHDNRIKGLWSPYEKSKSRENEWLFSLSSDGRIKMWDVSNLDTRDPEILSSVDTMCRPTCFSAWNSLINNTNNIKNTIKPYPSKTNNSKQNDNCKSVCEETTRSKSKRQKKV